MTKAALLTLAVITLTAGGLYGFYHYLDYLPVLSFLSRHGESFFPNQSVNGLMHRFFFNGNNLQWVSDQFPPFNPIVYACSLIAGAIILGPALFWQRKNAGPPRSGTAYSC